MHIHGNYINGKGQTVAVKIVTDGSTSTEIEIGTDGVYFTDEPLEITSEINDTFDVLLTHSASIRLYTDRHIPELYNALCRNAPVNISINGTCVFAGFVEPLSYSQPFVSVADELEINCVDCLSALQYSNFKNIGAAGVNYNTVKASAGQATFWSIISDILQPVSTSANISNQTVKVLYDGSKAINSTAANKYSIFSQLSISELLFLGDDEDDVDTQEDVLKELLKYLNLHIEQDGLTFRIFDWATLKGSGTVTWRDLVASSNVSQTRSTTALSLSNVSDDSTSIEIGEVYNRIELTADVTKIENVVENIFDEEHLTSPYTYNELYKTHVVYDKGVKGMGRAENYRLLCLGARYEMLDRTQIDLDGKAYGTEFYVRIMKHDSWKFPMLGDTSTDLVENFCGDDSTQDTILNWLGKHMGACLLKLGKAEWKPDVDDSSPTSKINWDTIMYIGKDYGRVWNQSTITWQPKPVTETELLASCPLAVYEGSKLGARISPADSDTTNYIVITGKIILVPGEETPQENSWKISNLENGSQVMLLYHDGLIGGGTLIRDNNSDDKCHASCGLWHREYNQETGQYNMVPVVNNATEYQDDFWQQGMVCFDSHLAEKYELKSDNNDKIDKVPVLACMLRIGDKVCVESLDLEGHNYTFEWQTYKTLEECVDIDEYYQQVIYLGFDPKQEDKLVNHEYDMCNNVTVDLKIDATGMAIPIHKGDNLTGDVHFEILGLVNSAYSKGNDSASVRHSDTWFRQYDISSYANAFHVLPRIKGVVLKKLEIELMSDNGQFDPIEDNDLIYVSDTDETFVNKNDGESFKITSELTAEEAAALGVRNVPKLSAPYNGSDAITSIYDRTKSTTAKPEQLWVDSYWHEYHQPRIVMEQGMETDGGRLDHYTHPALSGKTFYVIGRDILADGTVKLKLKEIES